MFSLFIVLQKMFRIICFHTKILRGIALVIPKRTGRNGGTKEPSRDIYAVVFFMFWCNCGQIDDYNHLIIDIIIKIIKANGQCCKFRRISRRGVYAEVYKFSLKTLILRCTCRISRPLLWLKSLGRNILVGIRDEA